MKKIKALYIHFPWCIRKCPYCDFNSYAIGSCPKDENLYIETLKHNFEQFIENFQNIYLSTIYIGGGTPSLISSDSIKSLIDFIAVRVPHEQSMEISMEMNPGTVDQQKLKNLKNVINRISFGVQSFTDRSLKALKRIHNAEQAVSIIKQAQDLGFENINVDIMHDLPYQTVDAAIHDLSTAINLSVQHISWYQLTMEEGTEFYLSSNLNIPNEDILDEIDLKGKQLLADHNFVHYEISGFSRESYFCRHNISYWNYDDYLGIGAGAHSKITDWDNKKIFRIAQDEEPYKFMQNRNFLKNLRDVNPESRPFEFFLNKARLLKQNISLEEFESLTFLKRAFIQSQLKKAQELDLIKYDDTFVTITEFGKRYLNSFLELFLV